MGVVAVATHVQLDQKFALKVVHDSMVQDPDIVERFMREARASAKLKSEHVCRVSDVDQLESGAPFIVMELLEGQDLQKVIAQGVLPVETAADYVLQACIALAEAHALGIVHRDLKPSNLFLTRRLDGTPLVKVLDFGIAKAPATHDLGLTNTAAVLGSPRYMSPEQLRSARDVDARTDIWALGVILYELVAGRVPFPATSLTEAAVKVAMDEPDPLDADPAYVRVVMRCLEKSASKRYQDVAAFAAELAPLAPSGAAHAELIARLLRREVVPERVAPPRVDALAATASTARTAAESATLREQTTLRGASGAIPTHREDREPVRSRRGWLLGGAAIAAVVVVVALGVRAGGRRSIAAIDSGAIAVASPVIGAADDGATPLVAVVTTDAPLAADAIASAADRTPTAVAVVGVDAGASSGRIDAGTAAPDPVARLRSKLREATANHDWPTAIAAGGRLAHLGKLSNDDDACCYAPAAERLIREQANSAIVPAAQGDCATAVREAHRIFDAAGRWDQIVAKAVDACEVTAAERAYASGHHAEALAAARAALSFVATDRRALRIAASASCQLKDPSAADYAKKYLGDRDNFVAGCKF